MKFVFIFLLGFVGFTAVAQDRWKVCFDKKVVLNVSAEDEEKNIVKVSPAHLKSKTFVVNYAAPTSQKGWERTIMLFDEKDQELKKQKGKKFSLKTSELKTLLNKYKTVKVYTINSPTDPKVKMQVRLRRVHLCTLVLE